MTEQKKTLSIDFNYLEMLGLHDYSRFKNKTLKDIVLLALEKEITSDKDYLDSLIDTKKDFFLPVTKPDLLTQTTPIIPKQEPEPSINQELNFIDEPLVDDSTQSLNLDELPSEPQDVISVIKKAYRGQPRFLKDEPLKTVTPKKKKAKPKAKPKPKTTSKTSVKKK